MLKALQNPFFYVKAYLLPYPLSVEYQASFVAGAFVLRTILAGIALIAALGLSWSFGEEDTSLQPLG